MKGLADLKATDGVRTIAHFPDPNHKNGICTHWTIFMPFGKVIYNEERLATLILNGIPDAVSTILCATRACPFWMKCLWELTC